MKSENPISKNLRLDHDNYNPINYGHLRLEYKLALADVSYKDVGTGVEVANLLQTLVDRVDSGKINSEFPLIGGSSKSLKPTNKFLQMKEDEIKYAQLNEIKRNDSISKRRQELKNILIQNADKVKKSRENRSAMLNRSAMTNQSSMNLRTQEYLEQLKKRSTEIKRLKTEAMKPEAELKSKNEMALFMKKKKGTEFAGQKAKEISEQFHKIKEEREVQKHKKSEKDQIEAKKVPERIEKAFKEHREALSEFKKEKDEEAEIEKACFEQMHAEEKEQLHRTFEKQRKLQDQWSVVNNPAFNGLLSNKLVQKLLVDAEIAPKFISLKRLPDLISRNAKLQEDPAYVDFEGFLKLLAAIAMDSSTGTNIDPIYTRSNRHERLTSKLVVNTSQTNLEKRVQSSASLNKSASVSPQGKIAPARKTDPASTLIQPGQKSRLENSRLTSKMPTMHIKPNKHEAPEIFKKILETLVQKRGMSSKVPTRIVSSVPHVEEPMPKEYDEYQD